MRSHDGDPKTLEYKGLEYKDTPVLQSAPYLQSVLEVFECDLLRVRLLVLHPGAEIGEHTDEVPEGAPEQARIHVPIVTNDKIEFIVEGERLQLAAGETWFVDTLRRHSLVNRGDTSRIHLVIDCLVNDWLKEKLCASDIP